MGCCSSGEREPPSITCTDSAIIHELETNLESEHVARNSLMIILNDLGQQKTDKDRLEILKNITDQKFILDDFDAILSCFTTSNGKLAATRILKKNLIGTQFNSGFLIKHFAKTSNSINHSESPSTEPLSPLITTYNNDDNNNNQTNSYT